MNKEIINRAKTHTVVHEYSGKYHFFKVKSGNGVTKYQVSIKVNCDCTFMGVVGNANNLICSHIIAVLKTISDNGEIPNESNVTA